MIQIPVLVFARYLRNRRTYGLKQVKYAEKKENQIPFKYYRSAIAAIMRYHRGGNDPIEFKKAREKLTKSLALCEKPGKAVILRNNLRAIANYQMHFGNRVFEIRSVPSLKLHAANIVISAKVDMYVLEDGRPMLIKLDLCKAKQNEVEVESMLAITSEAAKSEGLHISAKSVLKLRVEDGSESHGRELRPAELRDVYAAGVEIEGAWEGL
jgi:hypothetical protein